jgi:hypothetical protein
MIAPRPILLDRSDTAKITRPCWSVCRTITSESCRNQPSTAIHPIVLWRSQHQAVVVNSTLQAPRVLHVCGTDWDSGVLNAGRQRGLDLLVLARSRGFVSGGVLDGAVQCRTCASSTRPLEAKWLRAGVNFESLPQRSRHPCSQFEGPSPCIHILRLDQAAKLGYGPTPPRRGRHR